tara:strand:+ start:57 stop:464 length:408 start_codon:yes stop_codon:yes gene_type:complete
MIFKTSQNQKKLRMELKNICGQEYSLIEKIKKGFFGSPKYLILDMHPKKYNIDFINYSDMIFCTIEMRKKGLAIYFRYKNEEYVVMTIYNKFSFISNDGIFEIQAENITLKLRVKNLKLHKKFLTKLIQQRNYAN